MTDGKLLIFRWTRVIPMSNGLSLMQIRWSGERFGVMLLNEHRQRFFMYAEKFLELFSRPGEYIEIKLRDRRPNRAIGYYAGQVCGRINQDNDRVTIVLQVSDPYHDLTSDDEQETFKHIITSLQFTFLATELEQFRSVVTIMARDRALFDERLRAAEATPLKTRRPRETLPVTP